MRKKPAFVGNNMVLGLCTLLAATVMILTGDTYCLASYIPFHAAGPSISMEEAISMSMSMSMSMRALSLL